MKKVEARIEQIETGGLTYKIKKFLGRNPDGIYDQLDMSNRKDGRWHIISYALGYRQVGTFKVRRPHDFKERQDVICTLNERNKVVEVVIDHGRSSD